MIGGSARAGGMERAQAAMLTMQRAAFLALPSALALTKRIPVSLQNSSSHRNTHPSPWRHKQTDR